MEDQLYYNMFQDRLERELLKICTDAGMLSGILLRSDDIDLKWKELAPEYIADGVKEIADYPTVSVAWAGYIGMAVACWWNRDWAKLKGQPYSVLLGPNGFDDMDELMSHIRALGQPVGRAKLQADPKHKGIREIEQDISADFTCPHGRPPVSVPEPCSPRGPFLRSAVAAAGWRGGGICSSSACCIRKGRR